MWNSFSWKHNFQTFLYCFKTKKSQRDFFLYPGSDGEDLMGSKQAEGGRPILQRKKKKKRGEKKLGGRGEMCAVRHKQVKCTGSRTI